MMTQKPYTPPQIFRVELNQQQAILATCSGATTNVSSRATRGCATVLACKRSTSTGSTSAPPS